MSEMSCLSPLLVLLAATCSSLTAALEYHVAITGDDGGDGSAQHPFRTIQFAATVAQAGDTVTVHAGMYRERVHPPHGGVVFQAAAGEAVTISGAEPAKGWVHVGNDTYSLTLPSNASFGNFNPYLDVRFVEASACVSARARS